MHTRMHGPGGWPKVRKNCALEAGKDRIEGAIGNRRTGILLE